MHALNACIGSPVPLIPARSKARAPPAGSPARRRPPDRPAPRRRGFAPARAAARRDRRRPRRARSPSRRATAFTSAWRMLSSRIGLAPAPRFCRASSRSSSRSGPRSARDQAGGAVGQALRGAHVRDALAERAFHRRDARLASSTVGVLGRRPSRLVASRRAAAPGRNRPRPGSAT